MIFAKNLSLEVNTSVEFTEKHFLMCFMISTSEYSGLNNSNKVIDHFRYVKNVYYTVKNLDYKQL